MNDNIASAKATFENLLKLGYGVIDVRFKEYKRSVTGMNFIITLIDNDRDTFYIDMLKDYTGIEYKQSEILDIWYRVLEHKISMSNVLKRDVSIKVAAMDYSER